MEHTTAHLSYQLAQCGLTVCFRVNQSMIDITDDPAVAKCKVLPAVVCRSYQLNERCLAMLLVPKKNKPEPPMMIIPLFAEPEFC